VTSEKRQNQMNQTGQRGESLAVDYLRAQGYVILGNNWRCTLGELDIIAQKDDTLVFVEVRTRVARNTEDALASITLQKRARLLRAIHIYLKVHGLSDANWRVDVIAVALPRNAAPVIDHVEDALDW
jgi:putative endonuclease